MNPELSEVTETADATAIGEQAAKALIKGDDPTTAEEAEAELTRLDTIERTMREHNFTYAGEAIDLLEKHR